MLLARGRHCGGGHLRAALVAAALAALVLLALWHSQALGRRLLRNRLVTALLANHGAFEHAVVLLPPQPRWQPWRRAERIGLRDLPPWRVLSDLPGPRVYAWPDFLTPDETRHLRELALPHLQRSQVVAHEKGLGGGKVSEVRTSFGMFLTENLVGQDAVVRRMRAKIALATGINEDHFEPTQVLRYGPGQFYRPHTDWFDDKILRMAGDRGGQRVCTFLCYLNTPLSGGATAFPLVNLTYPAREGSCVQFWDVLPDGRGDHLATHSAEPLGPGAEKWSAPTWIRAHAFS